ncbi:LPXTG cell wall anchor domain-containing protein [Enterococcus sp. LJL99]
MKKNKLVLGILAGVAVVSVSTTAFAEEENAIKGKSTTESLTTEIKNRVNESTKTIDITPELELSTIDNVKVGAKGKLEVKAFEGMTDLKATFKTSVADSTIVSINDQGNWEALSIGKTKGTVDIEWDEASMKKIQEKYPDYDLVKKEMAQEINVTVIKANDEAVDITPKFEPGSIIAKIGDTGQFTVAPMGGVTNLTGKFEAHTIEGKDQGIISVDKNGKWTALKAGKTSLILDYTLSEETRKAIQDRNPGSDLVTRDIAQNIQVEVTPVGTIDITPVFDLTAIEGKVGDVGQIKVKPLEGITDTSGTFVITNSDESLISIDETGKWTALKAGTTEVTVTYKWSDAVMKQLTDKYPGYEFSTKENALSIKVTITEETMDTTGSSDTTKPAGKSLPATNEKNTAAISFAGIAIILLTIVGWSKKTLVFKRK